MTPRPPARAAGCPADRGPPAGPEAGGWRVVRVTADAGELHHRDPWAGGEGRVAWLCQPSRPALVLGSAQSPAAVDQARARAAGVEVVTRRSGGGAVLVVPDQVVWLDLAVPAGDPLWCADVGRAFWWVGRLWADALDEVGLGPARVHGGRPVRTSWSPTLCFAGLGAGEVTVEGRKVVGISQRRARPGAVFHSAAFLRLDARELVALLDLPEAARREAAAAHEAAAAPLGVPGLTVPDRASLEAVLLRRLP